MLVTVATSAPSRFPRPRLTEAQSGKQQISDLESESIEVICAGANPAHYLLDGLGVKNAVKTVLATRQVDAVIGWHKEVAFLPRLVRSSNAVFGMIVAGSYAMAEIDPRHRYRDLPQANQTTSNLQNMTRIARHFDYPALRDYFFLARTLRNADVIFARSESTRRETLEMFRLDPDRIVTCYCGIDSRFSDIQHSRSDQIEHLLFSGALREHKGIFDAIEALGKVAQSGFRNWKLRIAGWGDQQRVMQLAEQHGIADRIELLGKLDQTALRHQMQWAHLAILPTHGESFGLAIAEAQAAALPVVACDVGAVPEVVENGVTGWLVPPRCPQALADSIIDAIQNPKKSFEMGSRGRSRVTRLFTWENCAEKILQGINSVKAKQLPHDSKNLDDTRR